jgi:hypothetical protein
VIVSERRILANQINGKKSRGPQSWAGKMRVRQNAFRHGLSTIVQANPVYADEIAETVKAICGEHDHPLLVEQAVVIAECVALLRHVRIEKAAAIDWFRDSTAVSARRPGFSEARARFKEMQIALAELTQLHASSEGPWNLPGELRNPEVKPEKANTAVPAWKPATERQEDRAMRAAMPELQRLARYERRAWSRRNRALRRFMEIESQLADRAEVESAETQGGGNEYFLNQQ